MSGEQDDLAVSKAALDQIAKGITGSLAELKELGASAGTAGMGGGFSGLELSTLQSGHAALTSALDDFCERWGWGVRSLVQKANDFAAGVGLSAGLVHEEDQYVQGSFKVLANAAIGGNPYASEQDVIYKSWGDVLSDNPYTNFRDADYSAGSIAEAEKNSDAAWKQAWKDIAPRRDPSEMVWNTREQEQDMGEDR